MGTELARIEVSKKCGQFILKRIFGGSETGLSYDVSAPSEAVISQGIRLPRKAAVRMALEILRDRLQATFDAERVDEIGLFLLEQLRGRPALEVKK